MPEETIEASQEAVGAASDYHTTTTAFEDLGLSEPVLAGIRERGYRLPTPVQAQAIPKILEGKDLVVRSKTGTGKTAAFGIPLAERLADGAVSPSALVLCPTRELALQVGDEIASLGRPRGLSVAAIYGGASMKQQTDALANGAQVVVGTPGRVYDHIRRKTLDLSKAAVAVLDEADEMLNQGFYEEVTRILEHLPQSRQMLLFSATVPPDIDRLIGRFCRNPETILVSGDDLTVEGIENVVYHAVDTYPKPRNLLLLLEIEEPDNAIIFCNTRDDSALVAAFLNRNGLDAEVLNGDLPQSERERVIGKIKRGDLTFLVATDIAARGIDISDLSHVVNYSLPEDPAVYLHRVGRTGRIGRKGTALSLISGRDFVTLSAIERRYGVHFQQRTLPDKAEARKLWNERHLAKLREASSGTVYDAMLPLAQELAGLPDGERLTAFLLKHFFSETHRPSAAAPAAEAIGSRQDKRVSARKSAPEPAEDGTTKLWCNLGTADNIDAEAIRGQLASVSRCPPESIRRVDVGATHSYIVIDSNYADALANTSGQRVSDKEIKVERARKTSKRRK